MRQKSIHELAAMGVMSSEIALELSQAVKSGQNILVSGGTQAGKTTLLNALISETPLSQRVITIEEVFELQPRVPDLIQMQTRGPNLQGDGEITLRQLIKEALRMRPSRIIVGEVRQAEALDLLLALNSGLPGMGTLHANSARDAITKLQTLPLLAGENISHKFIAPTVASAIDLVVQVSLSIDGTRRIMEIARVTGRYENDRAEVETIWHWNGKVYERGLGALR
jgi:pilus assembly protein CpaF